MNATDLVVRALRQDDLDRLAAFRCSTGEPWEDEVEQQVRGPLPRRYLSTPPYFDGRMLLGFHNGELVVLGAHHIEPTLQPDVGYTEVIAVALAARGTLVRLPSGDQLTLGHFLLLTILKQMVRLGRHPRTFVRVDRRNERSLALLDRVGMREEHDDAIPGLLQRWGELPTR